MTGSRKSNAVEKLPTSRRDVLKGLLVGGTTGAESRTEAVKALIVGRSLAADAGAESGSQGAESAGSAGSDGIGSDSTGSQAGSSWNPIPVRATESVSVRSIVENTSKVSGPPYRLTEVAERRGLLGVSHPDNPREDPPFALRELITSQAITNEGIANESISSSDGWRNWVGDWGSGGGFTKFRPEGRRDLVEAIVKNARANATIRAVGAGHSHSRAAVPEENFVELSWYEDEVTGLVDKLGRPYQQADPDKVRVEAGAPIRYLARKLLLDDGKALQNRGSFDAQTLAGAINTSTHGTGARLGALSDSVVSVELATVVESPAQDGKPLVRLFRVEPDDGVTDRRRFEDDVGTHETTLIQDDDVFHSVVVGYGCMGVAYAYTVEVRDRYWLWENKENVLWKDFKDNIDALRGEPDPNSRFRSFDPTDPNDATGSRHFQFQVNLAQVQVSGKPKREDDPRCLVISHREPHEYNKGISFDRWPQEPNQWGRNWPPERKGKSALRKLVENVSGRSFHPKGQIGSASLGMNKNFQNNANNAPFQSQGSMHAANRVPTGYWSASFVALKRPTERDPDPPFDHPPDEPPLAISTEIAVPADQVAKAVEAVFERVISHELAFHIPMGVRFVDRSEHFLAPEYDGEDDPDGPVAKVEVPYAVEPWKSIVQDPTGPGRINTIPKDEMLDYAKTALRAVEDELIAMSENGELGFARPHMGKTNNVGVSDDDLSDLTDHYEEFDTWQTVHEAFDPFGTFNNEFTEAKGISIERD